MTDAALFFQAADGIRDGHVTGVQTCALPIWFTILRALLTYKNSFRMLFNQLFGTWPDEIRESLIKYHLKTLSKTEIGRASCSERPDTGTAARRRRENSWWNEAPNTQALRAHR